MRAIRIDVGVVLRARAIARDALGQRALSRHVVELHVEVVGNGAELVGIGLSARARVRDARRHREVVRGELLELGHAVAADLTRGLVFAVGELDDLADPVVEVARHEARLLVERQVVDLIRDALERGHVLVAADGGRVVRGAGIVGLGVVGRAGNRRARRRELAPTFMVVILGVARAAGRVVDIVPLARVVEDLFAVVCTTGVVVIGRELIRHNRKNKLVLVKPASALKLLDGCGFDLGLGVVLVADLLNKDGADRPGAYRHGGGLGVGRGRAGVACIGVVFSHVRAAGGIAVRVERHSRGYGIFLILCILGQALRVGDGDGRAVTKHLDCAVVQELAVAVVGRQVFPLGHERGNSLVGDDRVLKGRGLPGGAVGALLQPEGGVEHRRGAKARPLLEHVERGLRAVQEVGRGGKAGSMLYIDLAIIPAKAALLVNRLADVFPFLACFIPLVVGFVFNIRSRLGVPRPGFAGAFGCPLVVLNGIVAGLIPGIERRLGNNAAIAIVDGREAHIHVVVRIVEAAGILGLHLFDAVDEGLLRGGRRACAGKVVHHDGNLKAANAHAFLLGRGERAIRLRVFCQLDRRGGPGQRAVGFNTGHQTNGVPGGIREDDGAHIVGGGINRGPDLHRRLGALIVEVGVAVVGVAAHRFDIKGRHRDRAVLRCRRDLEGKAVRHALVVPADALEVLGHVNAHDARAVIVVVQGRILAGDFVFEVQDVSVLIARHGGPIVRVRVDQARVVAGPHAHRVFHAVVVGRRGRQARFAGVRHMNLGQEVRRVVENAVALPHVEVALNGRKIARVGNRGLFALVVGANRGNHRVGHRRIDIAAFIAAARVVGLVDRESRIRGRLIAVVEGLGCRDAHVLAFDFLKLPVVCHGPEGNILVDEVVEVVVEVVVVVIVRVGGSQVVNVKVDAVVVPQELNVVRADVGIAAVLGDPVAD